MSRLHLEGKDRERPFDQWWITLGGGTMVVCEGLGLYFSRNDALMAWLASITYLCIAIELIPLARADMKRIERNTARLRQERLRTEEEEDADDDTQVR